MGTGFNLDFNFEIEENNEENINYQPIFAGKPELKNSTPDAENLYGELCLSTDIIDDDQYVLDFTSLKYPSDWRGRGDFYYNVIDNHGNFATENLFEFDEEDIEEDVDELGETINYVIIEINEEGVYCAIDGGDKRLIVIDANNKGQEIRHKVSPNTTRVTVGKLLNVSWYSYPFSYQFIKIMNINTDDYRLIDPPPQAYKNEIIMKTDSSGMLISEGDIDYVNSKRKIRENTLSYAMMGGLTCKLTYFWNSTIYSDKLIFSINKIPERVLGSVNAGKLKFYLHVSGGIDMLNAYEDIVETNTELNVTDSSEYTISVECSEEKNNIWSFKTPIWVQAKIYTTPDGYETEYNRSEVFEKITHWSYKETSNGDKCLTLFGVPLSIDTPDIVQEEGWSQDCYVYRGTMIVEGKTYDKWEVYQVGVNDNYELDIEEPINENDTCTVIVLTDKIVTKKKVESDTENIIYNTKTCFNYDRTFNKDVTFDISNALEMSISNSSTVTASIGFDMNTVLGKEFWVFAVGEQVSSGAKNEIKQLNEYKKSQYITIYNNKLQFPSTIKMFDVLMFKNWIYQPDGNGYPIYLKTSKGFLTRSSKLNGVKMRIVSTAPTQQLSLVSSINNLVRTDNVMSFFINLGEYYDDNDKVYVLTRNIEHDKKYFLYTENEKSATSSQFYFTTYSDAAPILKVQVKPNDSLGWVDNDEYGVALSPFTRTGVALKYIDLSENINNRRFGFNVSEILDISTFEFMVYQKEI